MTTTNIFSERPKAWEKYLGVTQRIREGYVYSPEEAKTEFDVDIPEGWGVQITPWEQAESGYGFTQITPEGWRITPTGQYISPTGVSYTQADIERQQANIESLEPYVTPEGTYDIWAAMAAGIPRETLASLFGEEQVVQVETQQAQIEAAQQGIADIPNIYELYKSVFPQKAAIIQVDPWSLQTVMEFKDMETVIGELTQWMEEDAEGFIDAIARKGRTPETEALMRALFPEISEEDFDSIWGVRTLPWEAPRYGRRDVLIALDMVRVLPQFSQEEASLDWITNNQGEFLSRLQEIGPTREAQKIMQFFYPDMHNLDIYRFLKSEDKRGWFGKMWGQITAGIGDVLASFGGGLKRLGGPFEGFGEILAGGGEILQTQGVQDGGLGWGAVRMTPMMASLIVPAVGAYSVMGAVATKLAPLAFRGAGAFGISTTTAARLGPYAAHILQATGAAGVSRSLESFMEAGGAYEQMLAMGYSEDEASGATGQIFRRNLQLAGVDLFQFATALFPFSGIRPLQSLLNRGVIRYAARGTGLASVALTEGGEEYYQEIIQRQAMGEDISGWAISQNLSDEEIKQVTILGAMAGGMFAGGAQILSMINNTVLKNLPEEVRAGVDTRIADNMRAGMTRAQAETEALNIVAETQEGKSLIENALRVSEAQWYAGQMVVKDAARAEQLNTALNERIAETGLQNVAPVYVGIMPETARVIGGVRAELGAEEIRAGVEAEVGVEGEVRVEEGRIEQLRNLPIEMLSREQRKQLGVSKLVAKIKGINYKTLPLEYKAQIQDLVEDFDLAFRTNKTLTKRAGTRAYVERLQSEGLTHEAPEGILEMAYKTPLQSMTVSQLDMLYEEMNSLAHLGRLKNKLIKIQGQRRVDEAVNDLVGQLGVEVKPPRIISKETFQKGFWGGKKETLAGFLNRTFRVERILWSLDGFKEDGVFNKTFWQPVNEASKQKIRGVMRFEDKFRRLMIEHKIDPKKLMDEQIEVIPGKKLSPSEIIGVYLSSLNADNLLHLQYGNKFSPEAITQIIAQMTQEQRIVANFLHDYLESEAPSISQVRTQVEGKSLGAVKDYFPIRLQWQAEPEISFEKQVAVEESRRFIAKWASSKIAKQFLRERSHQAMQAVDIDAIPIVYQHVQAVEHYKAFAPVVRDLQLIMNDSKFREALIAKGGRPLYAVVDKWLKQVAETNPLRPTNNFEKVAKQLRVNAVTAVLGFNVVTALKQFPSFMTGMAYIGKVPAMKGLFTYLSDMRGTRALIKEFAPEIYNRTFEREIAEARLAKGVSKRITGKLSIREIFMWLTLTADRVAVSSLWQGAFDSYLAKNPDKFNEAADYATKVIRRTQPYFTIKDVPEYWRSGELAKGLTMFTNQLNQYWNMLVFDVYGAGRAGQISKVKATQRVIEGFIIPALLIGIIARSALPGDRKDIKNDIIAQCLSVIPILGSWMAGSYRGWYGQSGIITTEVFERFQNASYRAYKEDWLGLVRGMPELAGYITGVPVGQPKRTVEAILKLARDETDDWMQLIWGEWVRRQVTITQRLKKELTELEGLLGQIIEEEDKPLSIEALDFYDMVNFNSDIGEKLRDISPENVIRDGYSPLVIAWAEKEITEAAWKACPNTPLYKINADPREGDTFEQYYRQWQEYQEVEDKEGFVKDYPNYYMGNFTRQQLALLREYHSLYDEEQGIFLEEHPELTVNPRQEYLRTHPTENAQLALWGQAKVYTMEAYNELQRLIKELDIPINALPEQTLPPKASIENYFKYQDMVTEGASNSWEAQLLLAQDDELREWLGRQPITTPIASLEIKTQPEYREIWNKLNDSDHPEWVGNIEDKEEREAKIEELKDTMIGDMSYRQLEKKVEAIEKGTEANPIPDEVVNAHVQYFDILNQPEGTLYKNLEANLFLVDNPDYMAFRYNADLWSDPLTEEIDTADVPRWRLLVAHRDEIVEFNAIRDKYEAMSDDEINTLPTPEGIEPIDRLAKTTSQKRATLIERKEQEYREANPGFAQDMYRVKAYEDDIPTTYFNTYINWLSGKDQGRLVGWEDDWFMLEHIGFHNDVWVKILGNEAYPIKRRLTSGGVEYLEDRGGNPSKTPPTRELGQKYLTYQGLATREERDQYRLDNPDLDEWGVAVGIWEKTMSEKRRALGKTTAEIELIELWERYEEWQELLERLGV